MMAPEMQQQLSLRRKESSTTVGLAKNISYIYGTGTIVVTVAGQLHRVAAIQYRVSGTVARLQPVLRIHEILVRIRGSIPMTNRSGSCYFRQ
jgi:hypothetical protein